MPRRKRGDRGCTLRALDIPGPLTGYGDLAPGGTETTPFHPHSSSSSFGLRKLRLRHVAKGRPGSRGRPVRTDRVRAAYYRQGSACILFRIA